MVKHHKSNPEKRYLSSGARALAGIVLPYLTTVLVTFCGISLHGVVGEGATAIIGTLCTLAVWAALVTGLVLCIPLVRERLYNDRDTWGFAVFGFGLAVCVHIAVFFAFVILLGLWIGPAD